MTPIVGQLSDGSHRVWTPCGAIADVAGGVVIDTADFVIDPGHGGSSEPGAVGPSGLTEADLNLSVAGRIRDQLVGAGYTVVMTRNTDVRVPITTRAEIAQALDPIAFISVHFNAGGTPNSSTPGTEMYHQVGNESSRRLAGLIFEETRAVLDQYDIDWIAGAEAGTTFRANESGTDFYGVLRRPSPVLSVLTEYAFISNAQEEALVSDPAVQDQLATATVSAIRRFLGTNDPGTGFIDDPTPRPSTSGGGGSTYNCVDPQLEAAG